MRDGSSSYESWTRNALLAFSGVVLYQALRISKGTLSAAAMCGMLVVCVTLLLAVYAPPVRKIEALGAKSVVAVLGCGLTFQFLEFLASAIHYFPSNPLGYTVLITGILACGGLILAGATGRIAGEKGWFAAVIVAHFLLGIVYLQILEVPVIDVLVFQQDASAALLRGQDPYGLTFPNVYGAGTTFYAPSLVSNGRVLVLPYPPLSLLLCLPSYLLTGDVRYSHLAAISVAGLLMGLSGKGLLSKLAALLMLFSPDVFLVVRKSWTEAFVALFVVAVLFLYRSGRSPIVMLGLLVAVKQYGVLALPFAAWYLLRDRSVQAWCGMMLRAGAVALAVTVPFAVWHFRLFFQSIVMMQVLQPFRPDSLSIPAWLASLGFRQLPSWPAFVAVVVAGALLLRKLPRSAASFASGFAIVLMVFFILNKQAFLNYYFLVGACLCAAVAATGLQDAPGPGSLPSGESGLVGAAAPSSAP